MSWVPLKVNYYPTAIEAAPDQAVLEDAGIRTMLLDDNITALEWPLHRAVGGTKIAVRENDLERAVELLGGSVEEDADRVADWLNEEEIAANRLQTVGLISLAGTPLVLYFWVLWWRFRREHPRPSELSARRVLRGLLCALFSTLLLATLVYMMFTS